MQQQELINMKYFNSKQTIIYFDLLRILYSDIFMNLVHGIREFPVIKKEVLILSFNDVEG